MSNADQRDYWNSQGNWVSQQRSMDALFQPVTDLVLRTAALQQDDQVLDIGCGTGASVLDISDQLGAEGHVHGVDIAETLLNMARDRLAERSNATLTLADAAEAALGGPYDVVVSRFGVMFFNDTVAAFRNIASAVKPGGRFVLGTWGWAKDNPFFMMPARVAKSVLGEMPPIDRTLPGPFAMEDAARIIPQLDAAGLSDVQCTPTPVDLTPPVDLNRSVDQYLQIGPAKRAIEHYQPPPEQLSELRTAMSVELAKLKQDGVIKVPALINLYTARMAG